MKLCTQGDMEDIGGAAPRRSSSAAASSASSRRGASNAGPPEMLSAVQRASLTRQGYKLIGSHSGVKLCRWGWGCDYAALWEGVPAAN